MAVIIKNLGVGATSHSPGNGKSWIVKNIMATNTGTGNQTLTITAVGMNVVPPAMVVSGKTTVVLDDEITLTGAETIVITVSGSIDVILNGVERDV